MYPSSLRAYNDALRYCDQLQIAVEDLSAAMKGLVEAVKAHQAAIEKAYEEVAHA